MEKCKACGCEFEFIVGPNESPIPVQKVTKIYYRTKPSTGEVRDFMVSGEREYFVSHFQTCSDPSQFSRKGKKP